MGIPPRIAADPCVSAGGQGEARQQSESRSGYSIPSHSQGGGPGAVVPSKHIDSMLFQCWADVEDGGPILEQH